MDRREALKKLAVGGAIAAGGSLVLSSNPVAATASGLGIPGVPVAGQAIPGVSLSLTGGDKQLGFGAPAPPSGVTASYSWNIRSYDVAHPQVNGMLLTSGGNSQRQIGQPTCGGSCAYFAGNDLAVAETIFKSTSKNKKFKGGDTVTVGLMVTWASAGITVTAEFVLTAVVGTGITSSDMVPNSYYVT
jgi:hypothetical protein